MSRFWCPALVKSGIFSRFTGLHRSSRPVPSRVFRACPSSFHSLDAKRCEPCSRPAGSQSSLSWARYRIRSSNILGMTMRAAFLEYRQWIRNRQIATDKAKLPKSRWAGRKLPSKCDRNLGAQKSGAAEAAPLCVKMPRSSGLRNSPLRKVRSCSSWNHHPHWNAPGSLRLRRPGCATVQTPRGCSWKCLLLTLWPHG